MRGGQDLSSCDGIPEEPEHISFYCPRFAEEKKGLGTEALGGTVTPQNLIGKMLVRSCS